MVAILRSAEGCSEEKLLILLRRIDVIDVVRKCLSCTESTSMTSSGKSFFFRLHKINYRCRTQKNWIARLEGCCAYPKMAAMFQYSSTDACMRPPPATHHLGEKLCLCPLRIVVIFSLVWCNRFVKSNTRKCSQFCVEYDKK